jgi:hypothetical protein
MKLMKWLVPLLVLQSAAALAQPMSTPAKLETSPSNVQLRLDQAQSAAGVPILGQLVSALSPQATSTSAAYQLRIYRLDDPVSLQRYIRVWERHMISLPRFNITVHGVWLHKRTTLSSNPNDPVPSETVTAENANEIWALVSYPSLADVDRLTTQFVTSPDLQEDITAAGGPFTLTEVEATVIQPVRFSPLK